MEIIDKAILYEGFFKIFKIRIKDSDRIFEREQFHRGNSVAALLFDTVRKKLVLVRQFRTGTEDYLTEIVAGTVEHGEDYEATIEREIKEETGYKIDKSEFIGSFYMSPGSNTEKLFLYYCEVSEKISEGGGNSDENEKIELVYLDEFADAYSFEDAKTIIALNWYLNNKE